MKFLNLVKNMPNNKSNKNTNKKKIIFICMGISMRLFFLSFFCFFIDLFFGG